jgi:hypothetical protein
MRPIPAQQDVNRRPASKLAGMFGEGVVQIRDTLFPEEIERLRASAPKSFGRRSPASAARRQEISKDIRETVRNIVRRRGL